MGGRSARAADSAPERSCARGNDRLSGAVALVTGGSRGLGASYCSALAGAGACVVAMARRFDHGGATRFDDAGAIVPVACDLRDDRAVEDAVAGVVARLGRIDVLVNNAAVYPRFEPLSVGSSDWDEVLGLNVLGAYRMIRSVGPVMVAARQGSIVNISANAASHTAKGGPGHEGRIVYAVSKSALERLTDFLAEELRDADIAVNALRPGAVLTDSWRTIDPKAYDAAAESGRGQPNRPDVVGPALLHLATQRASTMTGQVLEATQFGASWGTAR